MKESKIVFINMNSLPNLKTSGIYPIGLTCICSHLKSLNINADIIDFLMEPHQFESLEFLDRNYDYIGFSIRNMGTDELDGEAFIEQYNEFISRIVKLAMKKNRNTKFIFGGSGYSIFAETFLKYFPYGIGIVGSGEEKIANLLTKNREDNRDITITNKDIFSNLYLDFDKDLISTYIKKGYDEIGIPTSRGICPLNCIYCSYNCIETEKFITRDINAIKQDIITLYALGVKKIFFTDTVFNCNLNHAKEICRMLINLNLKDLYWSAYIIPNVDEEFIELVSKSNCYNMIVSFDSFSKEMLKNLNKGFELYHIEQFISLCRKHKLPFKSLILFGGPGENEDTIRESCEFANKHLEKNQLLFSVGIRILPGSDLAKTLEIKNDSLVYPVYLYFPEEIFDWIFKYIDAKFIRISRFNRIITWRKGYKNLETIDNYTKNNIKILHSNNTNV